MKKLVLVMVLCLAMTAGAYEGYSPITSGGDNGTAVHVTNLNDSGTGSLRAVIAGLSGNQKIVFDVNGCINVTTEMRITKNNITVDGSSAPGNGITLVGTGGYNCLLGIKASDVIVKHMRFRNSGAEGIQIWTGYGVVIDHCSVSGSGDGAIDMNVGDHIVISRCLFGGNVEVHKAHCSYVSAHHNLYAWNNRRQPRIYGGGPYWDFRNNVVEYWTNTGTNCLQSDAINIIKNWYGDPGSGASCNAGFWSINDCTNVYTNGNYSDCGQDIDAFGNKGSPNTEPGVTTTSASVAYSSVLADCGAQPTDAVDQYYIDGGGTNPPAPDCAGGGGSGGGGGGGGEATFLSSDTKDGYVIESSETSGVGGSYKTTATYIGDSSSRQQYIAILWFDTSSIPDGATITSATLTIRRLGKGGDAGVNLGNLTVDIKNGYYGSDDNVRANDFESASTATNVATLPYPAANGDYSEAALNSSGRSSINKTGITNIKVRFTTDDDNDSTADYLNIYDSSSNPALSVIWQ
jgi:hypothetical protein